MFLNPANCENLHKWLNFHTISIQSSVFKILENVIWLPSFKRSKIGRETVFSDFKKRNNRIVNNEGYTMNGVGKSRTLD